MADIEVHGADIVDGQIRKMKVHFHRLPSRVIDRETAIAWLKDGHSFIPVVRGQRGTAIQLVEGEEEGSLFIRSDNDGTAAEDHLPDLPSAS